MTNRPDFIKKLQKVATKWRADASIIRNKVEQIYTSNSRIIEKDAPLS